MLFKHADLKEVITLYWAKRFYAIFNALITLKIKESYKLRIQLGTIQILIGLFALGGIFPAIAGKNS